MKIYIAIFLSLFYAMSQAQLKTPSLSPLSKTEQSIGFTKVIVEYSRPSVRGRNVFGKLGLLPYNEVWRSGANAATKITFTKPVKIEGNVVNKGSYTILSYPDENFWKIKWYKYSSANWSKYVNKEPVFTVRVPVMNVSTSVETLEIHFNNVALNSAEMIIEWEKVRLEIPIKVNEKEQILKSIDKAISGPNNSDYFQAALYLHETKTDLNKALEYIQKVTKYDNALFFQVAREAMILKDLKKNKKAVLVAKRALELSVKAKNDDFIRLSNKIIRELE